MPKLFGFSIDDSDKKPDSVVAPVPQNNEDGVDYFIQSGFYGQYVDIEGVYKTDIVRWLCTLSVTMRSKTWLMKRL